MSTHPIIQADPAPLQDLMGLSLAGLKSWLGNLGEKPFRAVQIFKWIHQHGVADFDDMTDISKALRSRLKVEACIKQVTITETHISEDGTRKWLIAVAGGIVEMVYIPEPKRATLCISSQVGCALACRFCSTGAQGFNRNLSAGEIIGQLWMAREQLKAHPDARPISNVVMMGMGEPLLNMDALLPALSIMIDDLAYGLSKRRVTVSTSGLVPQIDRLQQDADVALAVSLHAPFDELRNHIVPINKKYPIAALLAACKRYIGHHKHRRITMEYVMLKGVNDAPHHAQELARILHDVPCKINLIPFNPFPGTEYECSNTKDILSFQRFLLNKDYVVTIRKTRGQDIDAACGQLAGDIIDRTRRRARLQEAQARNEAAL